MTANKKRKFPKRNWGLFGVAETGKTTFIAGNCATPLYAIDPDNRFDAVEELVNGDVIYPKTPAGHTEPLALWQQAEAAVNKQGVAAISVDSVTKIYSRYARTASLANRMSEKEREAHGFGKNNAANLVDKSGAITMLATLASLRTEVYYVWHQRVGGINAQGKKEDHATISKIELETLSTSIGVHLEFMVVDGKYGVKVVKARDYGGRPANVGFTMWDSPRNYWRGAAERLEHLIYTSFDSRDEAIAWAAGYGWAEDAAGSALDKLGRQQLSQQQIWAGFVDAVAFPATEKVAPAPQRPTEVRAEKPAVRQPVQAASPVAEAAVPPPPEPPPYDPDKEFAKLGPPNEPVVDETAVSKAHEYGNGTKVKKVDVANFEKFKRNFNKPPWEEAQLHRAAGLETWAGLE